MFFSKKKDDTNQNSINSIAYAELSKRITDLESKLTLFTHRLEDMETNIASLRGKFNARVKGFEKEDKAIQKELDQEDKKQQSKPLINGEYIAFG